MRVLWLTLALLACPGLALAQTKISMSASSNRVAVGEPFAIEVRIESDGDEPDKVELPDLSDFQVLGRSTARPFSFSFGFGGGQRARVQSQTVYTFTLRAQDVGAHVIRPAIVTVGGRRVASQSLTILAVDPANAQAMDAPRQDPGGLMRRDLNEPPPQTGSTLDGAVVDGTMFVRTVADKKKAYVGEQVTVTVYLYLRGQLTDSHSISREPTLEGFWSHDLLPMQRSLTASRQEVNNRLYSVYVLRKFAAFPLRPGQLEIGAPVVEVGGGGSLFDLLNGPAKALKREGVKVPVTVLPLPRAPEPSAPTHTGTLSLEASLEPAQAKVGEASTLRVVARGSGNLRALTLETPRLPGVEVLPPEVDDKVSESLDRLGGTRTYRWLLLPRAPGTKTIPPFVVHAFDPASERYQSVRTQPLTFKVSGAEDPQAAAGAVNDRDPALPQFGPVRVESELRRRTTPMRERPFYWPTVLAAPALLGALLLARTLRARIRRRRASSGDQAGMREVDQKLEQAAQASGRGEASTALGLLQGALKKALEHKLGEPVGGLTSRALEALLAARGFDPQLAERVVAQLAALERARFDPGSQGAVELGQAQSAVRDATRAIARSKVEGAA